MASLNIWAKAMRLPFLTATAVPVILGSAIAWQQGFPFSWLLFAVALLGVSFAHLGTNLANDYYDHKSGNDEANATPTPFSGGSRVIQDGLIKAESIRNASFLFFTMALLSMAYLYWSTGYTALAVIGLVGGFIGFFYTAPPLKLGYRGFGELLTGVCFGPLVVAGSYAVQAGTIDRVSLLASVPVGLLIGLVLYINEFPDYEADKSVRKKTAVVLLGTRKAMGAYHNLLFFTYAFAAIFVVAGLLPLFALLVFLTLPLAIKAFLASRRYIQEGEDLRALLPANASTIMLHLSFGLLLSLSFVLDRLL